MNKAKFPEVPDQPGLYDWLYQNTDKDVNMYCQLTQGHSAILECGIGTGRLAIPLAEKGISVHGIDNSAAMLKEFDNKLKNLPKAVSDNIHLYEADMRNFELQQKFSFVFIPFASFVYLLTQEDQKSCLKSLKNHLEEDGTIVIDLPTWIEAEDEKWLANDMILRKEKQMVSPNGDTQEMWSTFRFDHSTQILEQDRHYRTYDATGLLKEERVVLWRSRFSFLGEFRLLLEVCGLKIVELFGDFELGEYNKNSEVAVVVIKPA